MAGTREDATLIVELAKWGAMIGLPEAEQEDLRRRLRPRTPPTRSTPRSRRCSSGTRRSERSSRTTFSTATSSTTGSGSPARGTASARPLSKARELAGVPELFANFEELGARARASGTRPRARARAAALLRLACHHWRPWRPLTVRFPSPSSTPASAGSPSCTSASCRFRTRTSSTSATPRASRTATAAPDELLGFARELAGILLERGAKLLVVACNSATAAALPALREELEGRVPVVGVVTPESRLAAAATAQRARRADRHAGHGRERRLRPRARRGRAGGRAARAWPRAELAPLIQEGGEVDAPRGELRRGALPPAASRRASTP